MTRGCVRSGCHGGQRAHTFRFPTGSQSSDEFLYTSFLILDQMKTSLGPMIDRASPEESALLRYMLPVEEGRQAHPPVKRRRVTPTLRGTRDPRYRAIVEWIGSLRSPHPDYELEYEFPAWLEALSKRQRGAVPPGEPATKTPPQQERVEEERAGQQPTSQPAVGDKEKPEQGADSRRP